jgi:DNA-directed RNA polymerase specialized sigma24 family protein
MRASEKECALAGNGFEEQISELMKALKPLLIEHGVDLATLSDAGKEALLEMDRNNIENSSEQLRSYFLELVLWNLFARGSSLWINSRTQAGNIVPLEIMTMAYVLWKDGLSLAEHYGVDSAAAAEIMALVTHKAADRVGNYDEDPECEPIRDIRKYVFTAFRYAIYMVAKKQSSPPKDFLEMDSLGKNWESGLTGIEKQIFCEELLKAMPPKAQRIFTSYYISQYSWKETAKGLSLTVGAAQKILSDAMIKTFGIRMQELRRIGFQQVTEIENYLKKKQRIH